MVQRALRWPAEWEPQAGVLVAWPHAQTDWAARLAAVESSYVALVTAITRHERCLICVADAKLQAHAQNLLVAADAQLQRVQFVQAPYDDTWLRDSGPIVLRDELAYEYADFRFTGWGGKFGAEQDDALIQRLLDQGVFVTGRHARHDFALEGGAIEGDGAGTLLTTWRCLHQRHPQLDRDALDDILREHLGAERVLWLQRGYLEGDDTDAHIDTLARFSPNGGIVFQACDDPNDDHYAELGAMRDELAALRDAQGRPYHLHALPWPRPIRDGQRRLAASYANYLVINDAVLVPGYDDPADAQAARIIGLAHPGRSVVSVPCRALIWQNGSLHCVTMQIPAGALRGLAG
jgi:agmatine/peptidylarginine deiminase